ncbi:glycosyltransferase [Christiangramia sp. SM2212]|uniref:Glycosyltransferase n=1 Tax=Christiangramia sediminicola TaxID=3073267 RepID=A0ABU1EN94_9FLAO|nr:glycosyltransferase [Christiangramia sp. SM2212]MDR5589693.1 glycosyltransferase [Christiangramia sp. SM2212]
MISIIISSYRESYFENLKYNIHKSIGAVDFEVVRIYNPAKMSLNKAYNLGAEKAKFPYLVFLHEDVTILSENWGEVLISYLKDQSVGIIGLAGNKKKFNLPTGCETGINKYRKVFVTHLPSEVLAAGHKEPTEVRTLDGVFLATRKEIWKSIKFNENIAGFHFYDLDFSLRVDRHYQNYVISSIKLLHHSLGNFGDEWIKSNLDFHNRAYEFDIPTKEEKEQVRIFWYKRLKNEDISFILKLKYLARMGVGMESIKYALRFLINHNYQ